MNSTNHQADLLSTDARLRISSGIRVQNPTVVIIVPIYRAVPTPEEDLSLRQLFALLPEADIVFIHPEAMKTRAYQKWPAGRLSLPDRHFLTATNYSRLLLSAEFYKYFHEYEFALIHQTDAFLCHGDLTPFTRPEIDYIGAPWIKPKRCPIWCLRGSRLLNLRWVTRAFAVGNGGLSLRRVKKVTEVIERNRFYATAARLTGTHEDIFFSSLCGNGPTRLHIPDQRFALSFAFDRDPRACYAANGHRLPFGLHNPWGYDREFFFSEILPQCRVSGFG